LFVIAGPIVYLYEIAGLVVDCLFHIGMSELQIALENETQFTDGYIYRQIRQKCPKHTLDIIDGY